MLCFVLLTLFLYLGWLNIYALAFPEKLSCAISPFQFNLMDGGFLLTFLDLQCFCINGGHHWLLDKLL